MKTQRRFFFLSLLAGLVTAPVILKRLNRTPYPHPEAKTGEWALVTGASAGLGVHFAHALAQRGYNLILAARREERLRSLAETLEARYGISVRIAPVDLSRSEEVGRLVSQIEQEKELAVLVNNAGFGHGRRFFNIEPERIVDMLRVHIEASVRLARAALPAMIARHRGAIINVSSVSSFFPIPLSHTYGATKAYLTFFSETLSGELYGSGVRVQALCPGFTRTEFHDAMGSAGRQVSLLPNFIWLKADDVVRASFEGLERGETVVVPGLIWKAVVALGANPVARPFVTRMFRRPFKL